MAIEEELKAAPLTRNVSPPHLTKKYDSQIVADFYRNGLTLSNVAPAIAVLSKRFPRFSDVLCSSPEETLRKAKEQLRWTFNATWEVSGQELLTDLIKLNLVHYNANPEFGYYDKRRISYEILKRLA